VSPVNITPPQYRADYQLIAYLKSKKFDVLNYIAPYDSPRARVESFNQAINRGVDALLPIAGNRFARDIIKRIDYTTLKQKRPIFCTFSAASVLLHSIFTECKLCTFYGPHISFIQTNSTRRENNYTVKAYWDMLTNNFKNEGSNTPILKNIFSRPGTHNEKIPFFGYANSTSTKIVGTLMPSFLQSIESAILSRYEIDLSGSILIIESDEISFTQAFNIISRLVKMSNIRKANAIVISSIATHRENPPNVRLAKQLYDPSKAEHFLNKVRKLIGSNLPVLYGFPMGHLRHKLTVPYGVKAELDIFTGDIRLLESPFRK